MRCSTLHSELLRYKLNSTEPVSSWHPRNLTNDFPVQLIATANKFVLNKLAFGPFPFVVSFSKFHEHDTQDLHARPSQHVQVVYESRWHPRNTSDTTDFLVTSATRKLLPWN